MDIEVSASGTVTININNEIFAFSSFTIETGNWYHLSISYSPPKHQKVKFNGNDVTNNFSTERNS